MDALRASAVFDSFEQLTRAVEALLAGGYAMIFVRAEDRFNNPLESGDRHMLLNVRPERSNHVGELRLCLR